MVLVNHKAHLGEFIRLNEAWISRYFSIEEIDRQLASAPWKIIENGGFVFSLVEGSRVIGVCALFRESDDVYQLARMAVSPECQGKGYGDALMMAALNKLQEVQAKQVYLLSNTKLAAAISLYKKHGFRVVTEGPHPDYARVDVVMERWVEDV